MSFYNQNSFQAPIGNFSFYKIENGFGFSPNETKQLHAFFAKHSGPERRLYYEDLTNMMAELNPHLSKEQLKIHVIKTFRTIDLNHDGTISYDEFMMAYAKSLKNYLNPNFHGLFVNPTFSH